LIKRGADISITSIENNTVQDYVEDSNVVDSESAVEPYIGGPVEKIGAEDWTFVYAEREGANGFPISRHYVVVHDDGEWLIFLQPVTVSTIKIVDQVRNKKHI